MQRKYRARPEPKNVSVLSEKLDCSDDHGAHAVSARDG